MRNISIIAACDIRGGFAKNGVIPWINEEVGKHDLKHFKQITDGHVCVMGRNTYNEIYNMRVARTSGEITELLPNRKSLVVTSKLHTPTPGATPVPSLRFARESHDFDNYDQPIFVIGGRRLFIEAIAWAEDVYLTIVNNDYNCDKFLPINTISKKFRVAEIDKQPNHAFLHYVR